MGQVVSEIGDHFNTISVFSLAMAATGSGLVVSGIMLSRAIPAVMAAPLAGVLLDRMDRKRIMIASDVVRAVLALGFILAERSGAITPLYVLSGMLMFASPFFTSGRSSILPSITTKEELHTANSLTQTTNWMALTIGTMLGGMSVMHFGYDWAFLFNAFSFSFSAFCVARIRGASRHLRAKRKMAPDGKAIRPWTEYIQGLRYMRATPLILGIGMIHVGWATGGGAAQILFTLFGVEVFERGAAGIGILWGCAGIGLLVGGWLGHKIGSLVKFEGYKRTISICYLIHGAAYVIFSQMQNFWAAAFFIGLSRAGVAVSSVLNFSQLLRHVDDEYRGRVFSTIESLTWSTMMLSMMGAGIASQYWGPRTIGAVAGVLSSTTAAYWAWANWSGRLPEPVAHEVEEGEVEMHEDSIS
jgi:MFS family permease